MTHQFPLTKSKTPSRLFARARADPLSVSFAKDLTLSNNVPNSNQFRMPCLRTLKHIVLSQNFLINKEEAQSRLRKFYLSSTNYRSMMIRIPLQTPSRPSPSPKHPSRLPSPRPLESLPVMILSSNHYHISISQPLPLDTISTHLPLIRLPKTPHRVPIESLAKDLAISWLPSIINIILLMILFALFAIPPTQIFPLFVSYQPTQFELNGTAPPTSPLPLIVTSSITIVPLLAHHLNHFRSETLVQAHTRSMASVFYMSLLTLKDDTNTSRFFISPRSLQL